VGEVSPLNALYAEFRGQGFEFFTVYVREPHPGEHYGAHRTWAQKLRYARDCRAQDGIEIPVLLDDLEGSVHGLYGTLPNMIYVIDLDGHIAYKAMWTDHAELRVVLENLVAAQQLRAQGLRLKASYSEKINYIPADYAGGVRDRVFDRAGPGAAADYRAVFAAPTESRPGS
jgi:hypothetical protein